MFSAVTNALLRHVPEGAAAQADPVRRLMESMEQHLAPPPPSTDFHAYFAWAEQRRQWRGSSEVWKKLAAGELLPQLKALAAAAAVQWLDDGSTAQLRVVRALATRICANPGCTNLRGCSEGRLRSRRCSGCREAQYCCRGCQLADFAAHGRVCRQLREGGPAPTHQRQ